MENDEKSVRIETLDEFYLHRDSVTLVRAWLAGSGIASGRLFRSVRRDGDVGEALDESQVPRIFKRRRSFQVSPCTCLCRHPLRWRIRWSARCTSGCSSGPCSPAALCAVTMLKT